MPGRSAALPDVLRDCLVEAVHVLEVVANRCASRAASFSPLGEEAITPVVDQVADVVVVRGVAQEQARILHSAPEVVDECIHSGLVLCQRCRQRIMACVCRLLWAYGPRFKHEGLLKG